MKILANIEQRRYFQISGVNGVFAGLWVGKAIFWATPIHLAARNQGKAIENGIRLAKLPFGGGCRIIQSHNLKFREFRTRRATAHKST